MRCTIAVLAVFAGVCCSTAMAQPQLWDVYTTSNQPFVNVTIDRYEADSLYMKSMDRLIVIHQDSIQLLLRRNKSKFAVGFLFGSMAGGVYGFSVSRDSESPFAPTSRALSTVFGAVLGGAVGGAIGMAQGGDTKYRLEKLDPERKRKLLVRLFS